MIRRTLYQRHWLYKRAWPVATAAALQATILSASQPSRHAGSLVVDKDFVNYQLFDVLNIEQNLFAKREKFSHLSREIVTESLDVAAKIAEEKFLPHNRKNDTTEPQWSPEKGVVMNSEVGEALQAFREAGFFSAHAALEDGGMQLPSCVFNSLMLPFNTANVGTMSYPFLTIAAGNMLKHAGTKLQHRKYLEPMLLGRFMGTMNLSEPHAGSSLGDITTRAVRKKDGTFAIKGTKMWISAGEHELSENIIHMVLAKVVDDSSGGSGSASASGVKGISLFIVPKYLVNEDGSLGAKNDVELMGLNHKMGYRGTTNCCLNYGENDACIGELLGKEGEGLKTMFLMMNEARIGVGTGAAALGYAGYAQSLQYAQLRTQGRLLTNKSPGSPQVPIISHPDVKRMLLAQKAFVEGSLALCMFGSYLVDVTTSSNSTSTSSSDTSSSSNSVTEQEEQKLNNQLFLDTLTPIIKSYPSEWCLEANKWAIQIFGGYGYTRDFPVEQIYRDNRLNMIHEGTNGIQGLDLLTRKVSANGGKGFKVVHNTIESTIRNVIEYSKTDATNGFILRDNASSLRVATNKLAEVTSVLLKTGKKNPELMISNSSEYLNMFGRVVVGWRWLIMEQISANKLLDHSSGGVVLDTAAKQFHTGKLITSQFYFKHELSKVSQQADLLTSLDDCNVIMPSECF